VREFDRPFTGDLVRELGRELAGDRELAMVLVAGDVAALAPVRCGSLAAGGFGRCLRGCALAVVGFLGRAVGAGAVVVAAAEVAGFAVAGGFVARVRYFDGDR